MRSDLTDITVVVDRSGSMASCKSDAEGGLNHFIDEQRKQPGRALFSLVQFDTEYEFVHRGLPIGEVPPFKLEPRGGTALLDAVGRAILETGERLAKMPEAERPGLVVFVILTDGEENSSSEFDLEDRYELVDAKPYPLVARGGVSTTSTGERRLVRRGIKPMIEHQQTKYGWQFTFLGANQDAFAAAGGMGIGAAGSAGYNTSHTHVALRASSANVTRMRSAAASGQQVVNSYTPEERKAMAGDDAADAVQQMTSVAVNS